MVLSNGRRAFAKIGFTDMRKQVNGLSVLVQELHPEGPFDGSYYVFCGKTRRIIKILYWDLNGFCLWMKRVEKDSFPWPKSGEEFDELSKEQIRLLLRGIDIWREHKQVNYAITG